MNSMIAVAALVLVVTVIVAAVGTVVKYQNGTAQSNPTSCLAMIVLLGIAVIIVGGGYVVMTWLLA